MSDYWIRASEINDYLYCNRSWWLKRTQNVQPRNVRSLATGTAYHRSHGRLVRQAAWLRKLAYALVVLVVAFLVLSIYLR